MNELVFISLAALVGFLVGILVTSVGVKNALENRGRVDTRKMGDTATRVMVALLAGGLAFGQTALTSAQTAVPLDIPTDVIFTEANNWIVVFAPIAAIGIGISIALAVLGYLGKMIKGAFT